MLLDISEASETKVMYKIIFMALITNQVWALYGRKIYLPEVFAQKNRGLPKKNEGKYFPVQTEKYVTYYMASGSFSYLFLRCFQLNLLFSEFVIHFIFSC